VICLFILWAHFSLLKRNDSSAAFAVFLGGLAHELFLVMTVPLLVWHWLADVHPRRGSFMWPTITLAAAGLLLLSASPPRPEVLKAATDAALPALGLVPLHDGLVTTSDIFTQPFFPMLTAMLRTWSNNLPNGIMAVGYACMPAAVILAIGLGSGLPSLGRTKPKSRLLQLSFVLAGMGPLAGLLIAYDLSRIANFTTLTSLLALAAGAKAETRCGAVT
jgi:hypothetical protein